MELFNPTMRSEPGDTYAKQRTPSCLVSGRGLQILSDRDMAVLIGLPFAVAWPGLAG
ncbi:MAG: hypothetical protein ACRECA_12440 [Pseudolabrys sp.]